MKILKKIINLVVLSIFSMMMLQISPALAGDKLQSIDELPTIGSNDAEIIRAQSTQNQLKNTVNNDIVILYKKDGENNVNQLSLEKSDFIAGSSLNNQVDVLRPSDTSKVDKIINEIEKNKSVLAVDHDSIGEAQDVPNDQSFKKQEEYLSNIEYNEVWNIPSKNKVKVAVTDTGLNFQHEDLKNRVEDTGLNYIEGEDFTDNRGHGTSVTSILNAETNNAIGMAGNSGISDVTAVPYKIGNKDGKSKSSILSSAIIDICKRDDIKIISASYSVGHSKVLSEAVQLAENKGILIVAAAGNNNTKVNYPAAYPTVIAAGAVNKDNTRCVPGDWKGDVDAGCCFGPELNLMAPGNGIVAAYKSGKYAIFGGTSCSTPMIAATAAIMLGQNENLTPSEIRQILYSTALDLGDPGKDDYYGYGLLQMNKAVAKAQEFSNYRGVTRIYNSVTGEHLYTTDRNEVSSLSQQPDWTDEGVKWESPIIGDPVYRLYSNLTHNHLYTSDTNEMETLLNSKAWTVDNNGKAVFYSGGDRGIYRLYNESLKMHLLTTDPVEYDFLPQHGWKQEGTKFACPFSW